MGADTRHMLILLDVHLSVTLSLFFFFFQAEDGIRVVAVTGVQTCALPIYAGEIVSWPENPAAFAVILEEAGISWTLSSEIVGYDAVNYGVWYDDAQLARVAYRHAQIARELNVNRIVVGECGHAHKALMVIADR